MKRFIAAIAVALLCAPVFAQQQYLGPTGYRAPTQSPPTPSCAGSNGNVIQTAYSGMYAAPGAEFDLWINGNDLVAVVRLPDGRWLEGAAYVGPSVRSLNVVMVGPGGNNGILTLCATNLTTDGFCSRIGAGLIVNNALQVGPQIYTRNRTPANNPFCVQ